MSKKFYYSNGSCSVKSYDRNTSTANFYVRLKQPIETLLVRDLEIDEKSNKSSIFSTV